MRCRAGCPARILGSIEMKRVAIVAMGVAVLAGIGWYGSPWAAGGMLVGVGIAVWIERKLQGG